MVLSQAVRRETVVLLVVPGGCCVGAFDGRVHNPGHN
jgi:hypothetical protein